MIQRFNDSLRTHQTNFYSGIELNTTRAFVSTKDKESAGTHLSDIFDMAHSPDVDASIELKNPSQQIGDHSAISFFDSQPRDFIPAGVVKRFVNVNNREGLARELNAKKGHQGILDYVIEQAPQLFAILANIPLRGDLLKALLAFQEARVDDSYLPILSNDHHQHQANGEKNKILSSVDKKFWTESECKRFYTSQWEILVPQFSTSEKEPNQDLHQRAILPFTSRDKDKKEGGFGEVFKVEIHENHIKDPSNVVSSQCRGCISRACSYSPLTV